MDRKTTTSRTARSLLRRDSLDDEDALPFWIDRRRGARESLLDHRADGGRVQGFGAIDADVAHARARTFQNLRWILEAHALKEKQIEPLRIGRDRKDRHRRSIR